MNPIKDYAWTIDLNVSEKNLEDWNQSNNNQSFLLWSLTQKIIDRKKYFDWASNFYNIPIVQNTFFEQNLMNQSQWSKVKNLHRWNEEIAPIYIWEDTVFIACLEKPKNHKSWSFKHRFVLVTDLALRMHWKSIKDFQKSTEKEIPIKAPTSLNNDTSLPEIEEERISFSPDESTDPERSHQTRESTPFYMKGITIDTPSEEDDFIKKAEYSQMSSTKKTNTIKSTKSKNFLDHITSIIKNPLLKNESKQKEIILNPKTISEKTDSEIIKVSPKPIQKEAPPKATLSSEKTNPEITKTNLEITNLTPKPIQKEAPPKVTLSSEKINPEITKTNLEITKITPKPIQKEAPPKVTLSSEKTNPEITKTNPEITNLTKTNFTIKYKENHDDFFNQVKSQFIGSLILKSRNNDLLFQNWSGRIEIKPEMETKTAANLNDFSIFKIVGKGHSYHGFVVDTEVNQKFFNSIGWSQYPKHVTAIPIQDEMNKLKFVFIGISMTNLDKQSVKKIEQQVLDHFNKSNTKKLAA